MPSSSNTSWTPSAGRHQLNIGSSLGRALRARKNNTPGQQPAKRNILPEREFYSVRYGFKPSLIDSTKPGSLEVRRANDNSTSSVTVEHASSQPGEIYVFPGNEVASKDWICVLIYDEETGGYTLEKLESSIALGPPEKRAGSTRPSRSPSAQVNSPPASTPATSTHQTADASNAKIEDFLSSSMLSNQSKELDDDDEEIPLNVQVKISPTQRPKKALPHRAHVQEETSSSLVLPTTKASTSTSIPPNSTYKKASKRVTPTLLDAEDETLEFGRSAKRNRASPAPVLPPIVESKRGLSPSRLELPGMADAVVQPPPIPVLSKPVQPKFKPSSSTSRSQPAAPLPLSPMPLAAGSDSEEEEWDEVAAPSSVAAGPMTVEDDGGEEIDINELETLINNHLEDDEQETENFLDVAIPPDESPVLSMGPPISLKQFAGGDSADDDEDEYSSSDDSDED
ncbi:MAG: hypothetical protein NXY57DRAFT_545542 [Lentinula lateritia]|uniref:Transcription elongation factor Eaf N-terminal domain-containing protein n=1 Tax=Lentinula lateritia TaxID=40482 RepID=A0ABQ8VEQ3_9AGAR|nr:MAG: hypothetical protein NXY57DRAFT_545542 [Lentinula lateritia]KAJ4491742.1 hypothetical protein C8R41DRAFT_376786 [Lentinula lateritia]